MRNRKVYEKKQQQREYAKALLFLAIVALILIGGCVYIHHCFTRMYDQMQAIGAAMETEDVESTMDSEVKKQARFCVVIDAGHGGKDVGTSTGNILEKDINLAVAWKVRDILEENNVKVILTRDSDEKVSLTQRVDMANVSGADLFISLHCNYYEEDAEINGLECYYHPDAAEGSMYADIIAHALEAAERVVVRETKAEDYYVLRHTTMPGVLVEMGFLSNHIEAQRLMEEEYQRELAEHIAEGIIVLLGEME